MESLPIDESLPEVIAALRDSGTVVLQAPAGADALAAEEADAVLRYDVVLGFNGPLFLLCFFIPVLIFQGGGALWRRRRGG